METRASLPAPKLGLFATATPARSVLGWALVASGLPVYLVWKRRIA